MTTETKIPIQYSPIGQTIKKFLHTKLGAFVGFHLGISGFNRIDREIGRFQRVYAPGETLRRGEYLQNVYDTDENGDPIRLKFCGVYRRQKDRSYNSRVDAGAALCASLISGTTLGGISAPGAAKYIAVSSATLTPAKGDTTLTSELAVNGFTRALGTAGTYTAPASLDGAASYVLTKTFTATGAQTVASAAIFDAASTGNMFVEANFASSATLATNDTLAVNWTVNL